VLLLKVVALRTFTGQMYAYYILCFDNYLISWCSVIDMFMNTYMINVSKIVILEHKVIQK